MIEPESITSAESIESTSWSIRSKPQMHKLAECLCNIHNDLCDTCSVATDYFSIKMTAVVATGFLSIVLDGYQIYLRLFGTDDTDDTDGTDGTGGTDGTDYKAVVENQKMIESIYLIMQTVMVFLGVFMVTNSGQNVTNEVQSFRLSQTNVENLLTENLSFQNERTAVYVHKIMISTNEQATKNKLLEFSLQLMHRKIKFSAMDLFHLNRKSLFMV